MSRKLLLILLRINLDKLFWLSLNKVISCFYAKRLQKRLKLKTYIFCIKIFLLIYIIFTYSFAILLTVLNDGSKKLLNPTLRSPSVFFFCNFIRLFLKASFSSIYARSYFLFVVRDTWSAIEYDVLIFVIQSFQNLY